MKNKVILTDVDGVCLDWSHAFLRFMKNEKCLDPVRTDICSLRDKYGVSYEELSDLFVEFDESKYIETMSPYKDSIKYIRKLHEEFGYVFHAISAIGGSENTQISRVKNLNSLFGFGVFEEVFCFGPISAEDIMDFKPCKRKYLEKYRDTGCLWVEDNIYHARDGFNLGLQAVLFDTPYNQNCFFPNIPRVKNWAEIYDMMK